MQILKIKKVDYLYRLPYPKRIFVVVFGFGMIYKAVNHILFLNNFFEAFLLFLFSIAYLYFVYKLIIDFIIKPKLIFDSGMLSIPIPWPWKVTINIDFDNIISLKKGKNLIILDVVHPKYKRVLIFKKYFPKKGDFERVCDALGEMLNR